MWCVCGWCSGRYKSESYRGFGVSDHIKDFSPFGKISRANMDVLVGCMLHVNGYARTHTHGMAKHTGNKQTRRRPWRATVVHTLEHTQSETHNLEDSADILPCPSPGKGPHIWVISEAKGNNRAEEATCRKMPSSPRG